MERIQLYKLKKLNLRFYIGFSILAFVYGLVGTIINLLRGFDLSFPGGDWLFPLFIAQGIIFFFSGYQQLKRGKCFIECGEQELRYLLPKAKAVESVTIADIEQLKMDGIEIYIQAKGFEHKIRLELIEWQELNRVKALIKALQQAIEKS